MTLRATTANLTLLLASVFATAQQPVAQFTDPANLRGERVRPRDGRELPIDQGARGLEQMLRRLNTRASLMLIVAHPDDEDGGMLTYYSRGLGARVAMLTLTRGEGGQNAMTGDFEDALGLLRTQELLSADRYLGVDQFFGTEVDFGFSKTKEEAFKKWTHERVLYDAVRSIRLYRPLVIAAVFIGGVTDGHGQHQVSGQIAQEAFKAAADPAVFPDMIAEGILPWQALKVYARVPTQSITDKGLFDYATGKYTAPRFENYVTGEVTTTAPSPDVIVHEGTTDPILSDNPAEDGSAPPRTPALSYVQFARIGLGMQKSQIGGGVRVPPAGAFDVAYHRYGSKLSNQPAHETSFFDGIDSSIEGIADLAPNAKGAVAVVLKTNLRGISHSISEAQLDLRPGHPELAANRLTEALKLTDMTIKNVESFAPQSLPLNEKQSVLHELRIKRIQLNDALLLADQIDFYLEPTEALLDKDRPILTTDKHLEIPVEFRNGDKREIDYLGGRLLLAQGSDYALTTPVSPFPDRLVGRSERIGQELKADLSKGLPASRPYFSRPSIEQPFYDLSMPALRNAPSTPEPVIFEVIFDDGGVKLYRQSVLVHFTGPLADEPQEIIPTVSLALSSKAEVVPSSNKSFAISLTATPVEKLIAVSALFVRKSGGDGKTITKPDHGYLPATSTLTLPLNTDEPVVVSGSALATDTHSYTEGYRPPRLRRISPAPTTTPPPPSASSPSTSTSPPPTASPTSPEPATPSSRRSPPSTSSPTSSPSPTSPPPSSPTTTPSSSASAPTPPTPTSTARPTQALLDYARNGGNVLVQYQTAEFTASDAPLPRSLSATLPKRSSTRPTPCNSSTRPHRSSPPPTRSPPADFNNWVEERGHGFLGSWDSHYNRPHRDPRPRPRPPNAAA